MNDRSESSSSASASRRKLAFSTWGGTTDTAGDPACSAFLAELCNVDRAAARTLTHGFHRYAGRMPPTVARGVIARFSAPGDLVVDPFCGSGTVMVEAYAAGRQAIGSDASPLAVLIARVRCTLLDDAMRDRLLTEADRISREAVGLARKRVKPDVPEWGSSEFTRFPPHVALELFTLLALLPPVVADPVDRALWLSFSSILGKFSANKREVDEDGDPVPNRFGRGMASRLFGDRVRELVDGLRALGALVPAGTPPPKIRLADARDLGHVGTATAALVASSPPYASVYDYAEMHDVSFRWLDLDRRPIDRSQIGARTPHGSNSSSAWEPARRAWLSEVVRVLRPDGHAFLAIGDGIVDDAPEDAVARTVDVGRDVGLSFVAVAAQSRPVHDPLLQYVFAGCARRESLILLRRR